MEIKKVLLRKDDGTKLVIIPRKSKISAGDYVKIILIENQKEAIQE